jgi:hypothetical protein
MTRPRKACKACKEAFALAVTTTPPVVPSIARYAIPARRAAAEPIACPVNPLTAPVHDGQSARHRSVYSQRPRNRAVTVLDPHPGQPFSSSPRNASSSASGARAFSRGVLLTR